ncbi:MAG: NusG domain II-containing protein [Lachnospiraceae bacterium]|nr:NusG domain II-containing protein [Lachnospiraceae bacterium]
MKKVSIFRKNDIIIVLVLLSIAAAGLFVFHLTHMGEGRKVRVTVDGELFGEYALGTSGAGTDRSEDGDSLPEFDAVAGGQGTLEMDVKSESQGNSKFDTAGKNSDNTSTDTSAGKENIQRIEIPGKVGKCILILSDGKANMESADCPNQICVHHSAISHTGETIVCLPNRVVIEVID